jgi:protein tyrosine/serine phosphatase
VLVGSLALAPAVSTAAGPASSNTVASRVAIDNFGQVSSTYYRGAQPDDRDYADLAALGVKLADGSAAEGSLVEAAGMKFHRIPMTTRVAPTQAQLAEFLALVSDPANQPVYVHCAGGRHRTGVMTAVYRMASQQWTAEQAFKEMKQYKFGADFLHPEFKRFVYAYRVEHPALLPAALPTATTATH